nr:MULTISPECIES: hypothetical protein [unclassified Pseudomonas]
MIWAGPRVSEPIALAWEDVDLKQGTVTFRRSKVRGACRVTKTRRSTRKVRLLEPAWDALRKLGDQPAQNGGHHRRRRAGQQDSPQTKAALRVPQHQERPTARQRLFREGQVLQRT